MEVVIMVIIMEVDYLNYSARRYPSRYRHPNIIEVLEWRILYNPRDHNFLVGQRTDRPAPPYSC